MIYSKIDDICEKKIYTVDTKDDYLIDYIDISSIDNPKKKITSFNTMNIKEAPSRAKQILKRGDILVSTIRPNLNAVAICDIDSSNIIVGSTGYCVLRCKNEVDISYVFYYCRSKQFIEGLINVATGASYPAVKNSDVKNSLIPIFELEMQKKISRVLDKAQKIIDKRKEQIEALDELVKSKFIEMFGDPYLNPKGFEMKQIKDVTQIVKGVTYKPEQVSDKGTIVLRSSNVQNSSFDLKDIVRIDKKIDEKFLVKYNDILMCNRNGSERLVGKVAKIPISSEPMTFGTFMTIIRSPYFNYLFSFFQTEGFRRQIKMQTSVAINQISIPLLESVKVPLPPMELQNEFAEFTNQVDKLKFEMETSLKELENNFNSLMQRAFNGEL